MGLELNWLGIIIGTIVSMVVAGLWYGKFFESAWRELTGVSEAASNEAGKTPMITLFITNLIITIGIGVVINFGYKFFGGKSISTALLVGFILWLAFSAAITIQHNSFELKPTKLTMINVLYQLVLILSISLIFGVLG